MNSLCSNLLSDLRCKDHGLLSCKHGYSKCYNLTEICNYRLDENNLLTPCMSGEHVENCRNIQCNMKFKCPGFYCIPWSYVCDGKWDCPGGYDEDKQLRCGVNRQCKYMFKCRNSQTCIHVGDICNDQKDCAFGDDESLCSLTGSLCLSSCLCLGSAIKCYNVRTENDLYLTSVSVYNVLLTSHCDHVFLAPLLKILKPLIVLSLTYNNLSSCDIIPGLHKMLMIDLGFNNIEHVSHDCLKYGFQIISILLNDNLISIFYKAYYSS